MPLAAKRKKGLVKHRKKVLADALKREAEATGAVVGALLDVQRRARAIVSDAGEVTPANVFKLQTRIKQDATQVFGALLKTLRQHAVDAWHAGAEDVDALIYTKHPLPSQIIEAVAPQRVFDATWNYWAGMISNESANAIARISTTVARASIGDIPIKQTMDEIGSNLTDSLTFKTIAIRAEAITRTEVGRIYSAAGATRMQQTKEYIPGLMKQWVCVAGDTRVTGLAISHVARRWHEGRMVELTSADGRIVTVTANHPILTRRGWIAAEFVHEGDELVYYKGEVESTSPRTGIVPDVDRVPPTIEDVFNAARDWSLNAGTMPRIVNLDVEGRNSQVEIIAADSDLLRDAETACSEGVRQLLLELTDMRLEELLTTSSRGQGFGGHLPSDVRCASSSNAASDDTGHVLAGAHDARLGLGANRLPDNPQALHDTGLGTVPQTGESAERCSPSVLFGYDRCVGVKVFSARRHVYDFTTANHWMIGNGLVAHNSTLDDRTRETHAEADGQVVPVDDVFIVGDDELEYPRDPGGSAEETINCRCVSVPVLPDEV